MSVTPDELVGQVTKLTSFPDVAIRINDALTSGDSSAADLGDIIRLDPALTATLLRLANSAMYPTTGPVDNIDRAVTIVGLQAIRDLAFGVSAAASFRSIPNELMSMEDFWKHSLYCADIAQQLGDTARVCRGQSLFTAGLLHDIGHLVMFSLSPDLSRQALEHSLDHSDGLMIYLSEREIFGFDHAEAGAALAERWQFPEMLVQAIRYHHAPFETDPASDAAVVTHLANCIAVLADLGTVDPGEGPTIDPRALAHLGLDASVIPQLIDDAHEDVPEFLSLFLS